MDDRPRCANPWCAGTDAACGRTPQEHMEQGLTIGEPFEAIPPGWRRTVIFGEETVAIHGARIDDEAGGLWLQFDDGWRWFSMTGRAKTTEELEAEFSTRPLRVVTPDSLKASTDG